MNTNANLLKLLVLISCVYWSGSVVAAHVNWQLTFFNESGQSVGNGQFSYNTEVTTCIEFNNGGSCNVYSPGSHIDAMEVQTVIDPISIELSGLDWGAGTSRTMYVQGWWNDNNILPGWQSKGRGGVRVIQNEWTLRKGYGDGFTQHELPDGQKFDYIDALTLTDFTEVSQTEWAGDWSEYHTLDTFYMPEIYGNRYPDVSTSNGSFKVEHINATVPIPGALVLFFSSLFILGFRVKKHN